MADIQPFCGIRYRCAGDDDLSLLLAPPYDVISLEEQERLYDSHPHNVVRLILGREKPGDDAQENKYLRASRYFRDWRRARILCTDETPSLYLYGQEFPDRDGELRHRLGVVAAVRLEEFDQGGVRPHENTHEPAKQDRLQLVRACRANLSAILSLCDDQAGRLNELIFEDSAQAPVAMARDLNGITHRLWQISDAARIERYRRALQPLRLYLADGHHRYETSLNYRRERRDAAAHWTGEEPANFTLMTIVDVDNPGLVVWPTHRLINAPHVPGLDRLRAALEAYFEVESINSGSPETLLPREPQSLVLVAREGVLRLRLRNSQAIEDWLPAGASEAVRGLEVTLLHQVLLEGILKREGLAKYQVQYTADPAEAIGLVNSGATQWAFLLPPPRVREVLAVAEAGGRMPPKSTFFYPKLITGMVIRSLEE